MTFQERLESDEPVEDVLHDLLADPDARSDEDVLVAALDRVVNHSAWANAARAVAALTDLIDATEDAHLGDGDTRTLLLGKALAVAPDNDDVARAYISAVAATSYRHEDGLSRVLSAASGPRRAWLGALESIAEYYVLAGYLGQPIYDDALRRAFARARESGADEATWQRVRAWVVSAQRDVPADLWSRFA